MHRLQFEKPVTILVGMGFPATIEGPMEAYSLLQDWPQASRNGSHTVALNACKAALVDEVDVETARAALVEFARRNDLLVSELTPPMMETSEPAPQVC